jgi:hypothetical protein
MTFAKSHIEGSPHHFLAQLAGGWSGTNMTWIDPDGTPLEAPIQGSVQMILDGRFALYLYQTSIDGEAQHGMLTIGYDTTLDRFEASWVDTYHNNTAIMFSVGQTKGSGVSLLGSYPSPDGGPDWGWRTEVQLVDRDHLSIDAYNVSPEGNEQRASKALLARAK